MPDRMKSSDEIVVGAQPSEAELKAMAEDGCQSVVNLRAEGEKMQPMEGVQTIGHESVKRMVQTSACRAG